MAEISAFRAWRYHERYSPDIGTLTSPLFDVVNNKQRDSLYLNSLNSIHLSVPKGDNPAKSASDTLDRWKMDQVLVQDEKPAIYAYYQHFSLPGSDHTYIRKGFVAMLRIHDWHDPKNQVMRHEATMPGYVNDRTALLEKTEVNVSPTHGLYTDPTHSVEALLDRAMRKPIYETEDYQGVKDTFGIIDDPEEIRQIISILEDKKIILADGHHRYEGSLDLIRKYQREQRDLPLSYRYHMMYFTNTESEDIRIMPTHRLIRGLPIEEPSLLRRLESDFIIKPIDNAPDVNEVILGKTWAFGLLIGDNAYKIRLKPEAYDKFNTNLPEDVKSLDNTILHHLVIDKCLDIPIDDQAFSPYLFYERNFTECLKEVIKGEATLAFITQEISIETVKKVCYSGHLLPQKSTYFYPKVITGFLFGSIAPNEL